MPSTRASAAVSSAGWLQLDGFILIPADCGGSGGAWRYFAAAETADVLVGIRSDPERLFGRRRIVSFVNIGLIQFLFGMRERRFNYITMYRLVVLRAMAIEYWRSVLPCRDDHQGEGTWRTDRRGRGELCPAARAARRHTPALILATVRDMLHYWLRIRDRAAMGHEGAKAVRPDKTGLADDPEGKSVNPVNLTYRDRRSNLLMRYSTDALVEAERRPACAQSGRPGASGWQPARLRWILVAILVIAAFLRLTNLNWDEGTHIHRDRRFLTTGGQDALELPQSLGQFFDSTTSPMSPYNKGYDFFVYGTLPIFIVRVVAQMADGVNQAFGLWNTASGTPVYMIGYDGVHLVGRALSGLFDLGCVWLIYIIGQRLYSKRAGLLAALFARSQHCRSNSRTSSRSTPTFGTFFALVTFYFAVRVAQGGGWGLSTWRSAPVSASVACRINLAPLAMSRCWPQASACGKSCKTQQADGGGSTVGQHVAAERLFRFVLMGVVAIAVFRVARQRHAFGGTSLLDFSFSAQWRSVCVRFSSSSRAMRTIRPAINGPTARHLSFPSSTWSSGAGLAAGAGRVGEAARGHDTGGAGLHPRYPLDRPRGVRWSSPPAAGLRGSAACSSGRASSTSSPCVTCCLSNRCWR